MPHTIKKPQRQWKCPADNIRQQTNGVLCFIVDAILCVSSSIRRNFDRMTANDGNAGLAAHFSSTHACALVDEGFYVLEVFIAVLSTSELKKLLHYQQLKSHLNFAGYLSNCIQNKEKVKCTAYCLVTLHYWGIGIA